MPEETISHFRILRKLGEGGMGEVYLAEDLTLSRTVALKVLRKEFATEADQLGRFLREARAASALDHPSVAHIYEVGEADGVPFIAMQYVEGQTLDDRLTAGAVPVAEVLSIGIQVGEALDEAHARGIIHRDLKPGNVIIGTRGQVMVLDFGLAKIEPHATSTQNINEMPTIVNTTPGLVVGTVQYMSPEQASGKNLDSRSDIFSLGIVLYEAVTGEHPFPGKTVMEVFSKIMTRDPEEPSEFRSLIPMELDRIILKCLAKKPEERYAKAAELVADLKNLQRETKPPSKRRSAPSRLAPRPAVLAVRLAVVLLVVLGVIAASVYFGASRSQTIRSVAVLPFKNVTALEETEYLSDGITDMTINSLSRIPYLKVLARGTVFAYKGKDLDPRVLGKDLRVDALVLGSVYQQSKDLSLQVSLVKTSDGTQIWGRRYLRRITDIQEAQLEISRDIADELQTRLNATPARQTAVAATPSSEAYHAYLQGLFYWNKRSGESLQKAAGLYREALDRDPDYAQAWAGLANTYALLSIYGVMPALEALPRAEEYAAKALTLDDSIAEAHAALALARMVLQRDWAAAESEIRRALALNPNYATAHHWYGSSILAAQGRFQEAEREMKRALDLDPLSLIINADTANTHLLARKYDRAVDQFRRTLEMNPDFYSARLYLAQTLAFQGKYDEAAAELLEARKIDDDPFITASLGFVYARAGKTEEAHQSLKSLDEVSTRRYVSPYFRAVVYAALRDFDAAFAALDQALEQHSEFALYLKVDPLMDDLRSDPRFADRLKLLHLQ